MRFSSSEGRPIICFTPPPASRHWSKPGPGHQTMHVDAQGKVSFQDMPCPGEGEKIEVRPAMPAPAVAPAPASPREGSIYEKPGGASSICRTQASGARGPGAQIQECAAAPAGRRPRAVAARQPPQGSVRAEKVRPPALRTRRFARRAPKNCASSQGAREGAGRTLNRAQEPSHAALRCPLRGAAVAVVQVGPVLWCSDGWISRQDRRALVSSAASPRTTSPTTMTLRAAQAVLGNVVLPVVQPASGGVVGQAGVDHWPRASASIPAAVPSRMAGRRPRPW